MRKLLEIVERASQFSEFRLKLLGVFHDRELLLSALRAIMMMSS
jgi:hypothetical protein